MEMEITDNMSNITWKTALKLKDPIVEDVASDVLTIADQEGYELHEQSINLPADTAQREEIKKLLKPLVTKKLQKIFVIGIGGSNLGAKAVLDALPDTKRPKMIWLDTCDDATVAQARAEAKHCRRPEEILIFIISKSGTTAETSENTASLLSAFSFSATQLASRIVAITDADSKLWNSAMEYGWNAFGIPQSVGGRYSVFSAVGLAPLYASGIDIDSFCEGGKSAKAIAQKSGWPIQHATYIVAMSKKAVVHDHFFFAPQLETLGKWIRQLEGESMGKDGKGMIPTVSIGSTDMHSMGQIYLGGPSVVATTFVYATSTSRLYRAILQGVQSAYSKKKRPFVSFALERIHERTLGEFMQGMMISVMVAGHRMDVNPFDQPNVEMYKTETRKILGA